MKNDRKKLTLHQETLRNLIRPECVQDVLNCTIPRTEPFTVCRDCPGERER